MAWLHLIWICISLFIVNAYFISRNKYNWTQAEDYCQTYCASNLASIHNNYQLTSAMAVLNDLMMNDQGSISNAWIGLNSDLEWTDRSLFDVSEQLVYSAVMNNDCISFKAMNNTCNYPLRPTDCDTALHAICNSCDGRLSALNELCYKDQWDIFSDSVDVSWDSCVIQFQGNITIMNKHQWYNKQGLFQIEYTFNKKFKSIPMFVITKNAMNDCK